YSFDGIWASASLLHVPRGKATNVVEAWTRLLKPRSILFVSVKMGSGDGYVPNPNDTDRKRYFTYFSEEDFLSLFASRFDLVEGSYGVDGEWIKGLFRLKPGPPRAFHNF
ncbi:MAG: class I SAM-dependent methyltransferase, partial [archaeon]